MRHVRHPRCINQFTALAPASRPALAVSVCVLAASLAGAGSSGRAVAAPQSNPIVIENQRPGTTAWQATKMIEWKPDADAWARYIADEFMIINNTTIRNKEQRVAIAQRQQDAGTGAPGDPVTAMRIYDFGSNAAVMTSRHTPYRGGKPYTNVRVWVLRDGRWQLALSQQVTIQSATPVAAMVGKL